MYTAVGFLHPDRAEMPGRCCNLGGGGGQARVEVSALFVRYAFEIVMDNVDKCATGSGGDEGKSGVLVGNF